MKKLLCLIFLLTEILMYSQDYTALHNKYWYYRTRLRNDFMKVGLTHGCSIPMEERGDGYSPDPNDPFNFSDPNSGEQGKWGDAMGELGYYLGVLATEYNLLSRNNQETDSVRYELYCALEALNRMDYYAEPYFTHAIANSTNPQSFSAAYDGFMLRDDVPIDFVQNNVKHFNYFGNKGFCSKVKIKNISTTSGNGAQMQGESYHPPKYVYNANLGINIMVKPGYYDKNYAGSYISQDNWINCIVGLALVRKFVPSGTNYNNLSFSDGNGSNINQEAFSIALRVMNYFKQSANWATSYPSGNLVGSNWGGVGAGLAFAHAESLNKMDQYKWGHFVQPDPISFNNWCEYNDWRHDGNWLVQLYKNIIIGAMFINYVSTSHSSGSLGNFYTQSPTVSSGEIIYKSTQLWPNATNPDVAVQVCNLSAVGNCEYTMRGVDTKHQLQHHINAHQIWHPELIRVALHGEGECFTTDLNTSYFDAGVSLISNAPCYGPAKWDENGNVNPNHEWDTQTRLDHPESRNGSGWPGEYNGIDYMLYHNLVTIIDADRNGMNSSKQMVDLGRRHLTKPYPWVIGNTTWGTTIKPAVVKSFEYITANNTVGTQYFLFTNVSYLAGKEITLGDGFSATSQGYFTAAIQHFECDEILTNPLDPSVNMRAANSDNKGTDAGTYPDLLPTSYNYVTQADNKHIINNYSNYIPLLLPADSLTNAKTPLLAASLVAEVAPNPSAGTSKLIISKPDLVKSIEVLNPAGQLLFSLKTISYSNDLELGNTAKGIYTIILRGINEDLITKKLVIQ